MDTARVTALCAPAGMAAASALPLPSCKEKTIATNTMPVQSLLNTIHVTPVQAYATDRSNIPVGNIVIYLRQLAQIIAVDFSQLAAVAQKYPLCAMFKHNLAHIGLVG